MVRLWPVLVIYPIFPIHLVVACDFTFPTQCRPQSALSQSVVPKACCQGQNCEYQQSLFDNPQRSTLLGEGSMGVVRARSHPLDDTIYVVKTFYPYPNESATHFTSTVQHEYDATTRMLGPGFAETYALFTNDQGVHMISEYLPLSLVSLLPYLDEHDIQCILTMILHAVSRMHEAGLAHRDLKADNILLTAQGHAKLIDLGEAVSTTGKSYGLVGTPPYLAPELYAGVDYDAGAVDCWSLGVLMVELYTGRFPWRSSVMEEDEQFVRFAKDPDAFLDEMRIPFSVRAVIGGLLSVDVAGRWSVWDALGSESFDGGTCEMDVDACCTSTYMSCDKHCCWEGTSVVVGDSLA